MTVVSDHFTGAKVVPAFLNSPIKIAATTTAEERLPDVLVLTSKMSRGDEAAFREFYALYFNRLLRYAMVVAKGQEEVAHEAVQLTFVRVAWHVRKFDSETAFWNWLAMIARNCVADEMRRRERYQSLLLRVFQRRPAVTDLKANEADEEFLKLLEKEIAGLPADERTLIERKYCAGETASSLAAEWRMTEKAMESRLLRIRRKLKAAMLDQLKNETE